MEYDKIILKTIENKYKSVKEISEETNISRTRVTFRMKQLKKFDMVYRIDSRGTEGKYPSSKYKKKAN